MFLYSATTTNNRRSLRQYNDVQKTCQDLVAEALRRQTCDNVTVVMIGFNRIDPVDGGSRIIPRRRLHPYVKKEKDTPQRSRPRKRIALKGLRSLMQALGACHK